MLTVICLRSSTGPTRLTLALSAKQHRDPFRRDLALGIFHELPYGPGPSQFHQQASPGRPDAADGEVHAPTDFAVGDWWVSNE